MEGSEMLVQGSNHAVFENRLFIDRSRPFDPVAFLGEKWSIAEEDEWSLSLTEFNLDVLSFSPLFKEGEVSLNGEGRLKRLEWLFVARLDAHIFQAIWQFRTLVTAHFQNQVGEGKHFLFSDGTIFRNPEGHRYGLCFYWVNGEMRWAKNRLSDDWSNDNQTLVLI